MPRSVSLRQGICAKFLPPASLNAVGVLHGDLFQRLEAIGGKTGRDDRDLARALLEGSVASTCSVAGSSHFARPNRDWKVPRLSMALAEPPPATPGRPWRRTGRDRDRQGRRPPRRDAVKLATIASGEKSPARRGLRSRCRRPARRSGGCVEIGRQRRALPAAAAWRPARFRPHRSPTLAVDAPQYCGKSGASRMRSQPLACSAASWSAISMVGRSAFFGTAGPHDGFPQKGLAQRLGLLSSVIAAQRRLAARDVPDQADRREPIRAGLIREDDPVQDRLPQPARPSSTTRRSDRKAAR